MSEKLDYTKTLDKLQNIVYKELKASGFSKKGRTFNKIVDEGIVHVIKVYTDRLVSTWASL